ncbi:hypothetical protein LTR53_002256 [Teratosphaeriaceae sp. CCFEE 6253]|nr:hypothetical protein LTR53_002256 [Teratosphaeriaceae sp. CCFEE 6253]
MPCDHADHTHIWPETGVLMIERCEVYCGYCAAAGVPKKRFKHGWFVRRHVDGVHLKKGKGDHGLIILAKGWSTKPDGSKTTVAKAKRAKKAKSLSLSLSPTPSLSPPHGNEMSEAEAAQNESFAAAYASGDELALNLTVNAPGHSQQTTRHTNHIHYSSDEGLSDFEDYLAGQARLNGFDNVVMPSQPHTGVPQDLAASQLYDDGMTCNPAVLQSIESSIPNDAGLPFDVADDCLA